MARFYIIEAEEIANFIKKKASIKQSKFYNQIKLIPEFYDQHFKDYCN
jgi:hypothetical protein